MSYVECKNKNEYIIDDKRFIRDIKKIECVRKLDNEYVLECKIIQRGEHSYAFSTLNEYIFRNGKKLWLSENAKKKVENAIKEFEETIKEAEKSFSKAFLNEFGITILYKRSNTFYYDCIIKWENENLGESIRFIKNTDIEWMIREIEYESRYFMDKASYNKRDEIFNRLFYSKETINLNPLYISAKENHDEAFEKELKLHYHIESKEDCILLSEIYGIRVLPTLPKKYNKKYIVDYKTINIPLIGYTISHRPYFAMPGSTHEKWGLNPHYKVGTDAAGIEEESITFSEYLKLFDEIDND